jgi:hypothetical protein
MHAWKRDTSPRYASYLHVITSNYYDEPEDRHFETPRDPLPRQNRTSSILFHTCFVTADPASRNNGSSASLQVDCPSVRLAKEVDNLVSLWARRRRNQIAKQRGVSSAQIPPQSNRRRTQACLVRKTLALACQQRAFGQRRHLCQSVRCASTPILKRSALSGLPLRPLRPVSEGKNDQRYETK